MATSGAASAVRRKKGSPGARESNDRERRRREPLTREGIVKTALALIEERGLAGFSIRELGARLRVEPMSVYHHFPSKRHLLDALVDHAMASIEMPAQGASPIERLRRLCYAYRAMAHRFPGLYPLLALHRLNTPVGVGTIERVLELIHAIEPDPERAARQFRAMGYFLTGAALDETAGYARGPSAADPADDRYIEEHCPRLAIAGRYFKSSEWDATFALGLEALLAGFSVAPGSNPQRRASTS
jgi:AcrR family transcriptional regulator